MKPGVYVIRAGGGGGGEEEVGRTYNCRHLESLKRYSSSLLGPYNRTPGEVVEGEAVEGEVVEGRTYSCRHLESLKDCS